MRNSFVVRVLGLFPAGRIALRACAVSIFVGLPIGAVVPSDFRNKVVEFFGIVLGAPEGRSDLRPFTLLKVRKQMVA